MDDTQSSAPAGTTSSPSFLNTTLQHFMENMLKGFHVDIANTNAELITHMNGKMAELVERMDKRHKELLAKQRAQGETLKLILARLDSLGPRPSASPSSSAPEHIPPPPENIPSDLHHTELEPPIPPVSSPLEPKPKDILYSVDNPETNETIHIVIQDSPPRAQPQPTPTPIPSPTHTEEISPSSSGHHSADDTEKVEITTMVVYQPPPVPPRDDIHIPPLNLPEPESSSSSFDSSSSDGSHSSLVLPIKPISSVKPSD